MSPATIRPGLLAGIEMRNPVTTYRMCGKTYTWDELREVSKAEAADLPPETWREIGRASCRERVCLAV